MGTAWINLYYDGANGTSRSITSSENYGPETVDRLYHLRDVSEKQYMIMKSQLGYKVTRVHTDEGIEGKFALCFISSIIRSEISQACKALEQDTKQMIREIDRAAFQTVQGKDRLPLSFQF